MKEGSENKVYTYAGVFTMPAGLMDTYDSFIVITAKQAKLKSLLWSVKFRELIGNNMIPLEANDTQDLYLAIEPNPAGYIANSFQNTGFLGASGVEDQFNNGNTIALNQPGQYFFNSFITSYDINPYFFWHNYGLLDVMAHISLIIEVEEVAVL